MTEALFFVYWEPTFVFYDSLLYQNLAPVDDVKPWF